jgi:nucleotide-binding universal stress UspA family protein
MMLKSASVEDSLRAGQEMVSSAAAFGERLGVAVETGVRVAPNAEEEIIGFANSGAFDLLVLGTSTRALTDRPFLRSPGLLYPRERSTSRSRSESSTIEFGHIARLRVRCAPPKKPDGRVPNGTPKGQHPPESLRPVDRPDEATLKA